MALCTQSIILSCYFRNTIIGVVRVEIFKDVHITFFIKRREFYMMNFRRIPKVKELLKYTK
jgi:hypothetical protein